MKKRCILVVDNKEGLTPSYRTELIKMMKEISMGFDAQLVDVRIGRNHIEIDIKIKEKNLKGLSEQINRIFPILDIVMIDYEENEQVNHEEIIRKAVELFNMERFWETHEALEELWRRSVEGDEKEIIHTIILISAAYVHFQKNNPDRFFKVLNRAFDKLENTKLKKYRGIDVERIRDKVREMLRRREVDFFKIVLER